MISEDDIWNFRASDDWYVVGLSIEELIEKLGSQHSNYTLIDWGFVTHWLLNDYRWTGIKVVVNSNWQIVEGIEYLNTIVNLQSGEYWAGLSGKTKRSLLRSTIRVVILQN